MVLLKARNRGKLLFLFSFAVGLSVSFNNCSKIKVADLPSSGSDQAAAASGITINGGATYAQSTEVNLSLDSLGASEMYITNNAGCGSGGTWQPYNRSSGWTLDRSNQEDTVYAKFRASNQTESSCVNASIIHDDIAPAIVVDNPPPILTNSNNISATFHASDLGSGVKLLYCILPGQKSAVSCSGIYNSSGLSDGSYLVQFTATDNAGNVSTPVPQAFTVDTTPPTVTLNSTPPSVSSSTSGAFVFVGMDNLSGVKGYECLLDQGSYTPCSSGQTYNGLALGAHNFSVHAIDNAGNVSIPATYKWTVDSSMPTVYFTQTPLPVTNAATATFAFAGKDGLGAALTKFECSFNGATFAACSTPLNLSGLAEGKYTFGVRGQSLAGVYSKELDYSWTIDLTSPTIAITSGPKVLTNSNSANFTFTATDSLSGIATVTCSLDGGAAQNCASLVQSFNNLTGDTQHSFQVMAADNAGNVTVSTPYTWYIDNSLPVLQITSTPPMLSSASSAQFQILATDQHGPITYSCSLDNPMSLTTCSTTMNYSSLSDGGHTFYAQAQDGAGNLSQIQSYAWTIETAGPKITFTQTPGPKILTNAAGVLSYTITDPLSNVVSASCVLSSGSISSPINLSPCSTSAGTLTFPLLSGVGSYTFTLTATNAVGLTSTQSFSFMVAAVVPICTTSLQTTTVPTKMIFIVDTSGSNGTSNCIKSANCTDLGKVVRGGSIQTFFNDYGTLPNFSWAFETFEGTTATALTNIASAPSSLVFTNSTGMSSAISNFYKIADAGNTPYAAALNMAKTAISKDPDLNSAKNPQYIVVFMSDGQPNPAMTALAANASVSGIIALSPGRISFNTIYYGAGDPVASALLSGMAKAGSGNFLDTSTNPTVKDFQISSLVSVPVTTCK